MKVRIQVIKVYDIDVSAPDDEEALEMAYAMQSADIEKNGRFVDATTDHAETHASMQTAERDYHECVNELRRTRPVG